MNGFVQHDDVRFLAIADAYSDRRERAKAQLNQRYGGQVTEAYGDFREVLKRDDIDGVVVCTPDHWHVPVALYAARAGKDMYTEKPLGICIEQDLAAREIVEKHNRIFQYGTQQRSMAQFCKVT